MSGLENIFKTVSDIVEDLGEHGNIDISPAARPTGRPSNRKVVPLASDDFGKPVFCVPGLGRLDDCGVLVVADALKREGINARVTGATPAIKNEEAASICLCYLENVSKARLDYAVRKLSRSAPAVRVVVCLFTDASSFLPLPSKAWSRLARSRLPSRVLQIPRAAPVASLGTNAIIGGSGFKYFGGLRHVPD